jgi:CTP synthase
LEAFVHAGAINQCKVQIVNIHSEHLNSKNIEDKLKELDGLLVAPGFGSRGVEGKIEAVRYARENKIPFFGICLGMQMAVIEFGRNVLGWSDAHSTEMDPNTTHPVIALMDEQKKVKNKGGTMRLGAYDCEIDEDSLAYQIYQNKEISERHRHRWEFNNKYLSDYVNAGLITSGINKAKGLVEIIELKDHPFFIGVQYHPELKSTVENPHPIFVNFVKAAKEYAAASQTVQSVGKNQTV